MRPCTLPALLTFCFAAALLAAPPAGAKSRGSGSSASKSSSGKSHAHGGSATHHRRGAISGAVASTALYPRYSYASPYGSDCLRRDEAGNCVEWRGTAGAVMPAPRYIEPPSFANP